MKLCDTVLFSSDQPDAAPAMAHRDYCQALVGSRDEFAEAKWTLDLAATDNPFKTSVRPLPSL